MNLDTSILLKLCKSAFRIERLSEIIMIAFAVTSLSNVHDFLGSAGHNKESAWALAVALGTSLVAVSIMLCHTDFDHERTAFFWLVGAGVGLGLLSGALQYSSYSKHLSGYWPLVLGFGTPLLGEVALAFAVNAYLKAQTRSRFRGIGDTLEDAVSNFLATAVDEMNGEFIKKYLERTVNTMAKVAVDSVSNKAMRFYTTRPVTPVNGQLDLSPVPPGGRPIPAISDSNGASNGHSDAVQIEEITAHNEEVVGQGSFQEKMKQGKQEKIQTRRRQLLELIHQKGKDVEISELARLLKVKRDTIYRDLEALEDAEVIFRSEEDGIEVIGSL